MGGWRDGRSAGVQPAGGQSSVSRPAAPVIPVRTALPWDAGEVIRLAALMYQAMGMDGQKNGECDNRDICPHGVKRSLTM